MIEQKFKGQFNEPLVILTTINNILEKFINFLSTIKLLQQRNIRKDGDENDFTGFTRCKILIRRANGRT